MRGPAKFAGRVLCLGLCLLLTACATTKPVETDPETPAPIVETPDIETAPIATPEPEPVPAPVQTTPLPTPTPPPAPEVEIHQSGSGFAQLDSWREADATPALQSFRKSCDVWKRRKGGDWLNPNLPEYGKVSDWQEACMQAQAAAINQYGARTFFESYFEPVRLSTDAANTGQLTGYYAPQIDVRRQADYEFSEPLLARPKELHLQKLPRKDINAGTSRVLAYGRPIDVFFLQIQGSGRIAFEDGSVYRAAFDGHNSHSYVSIGKLLVARGEMTLEQASKQSIESWMIQAGPERARALMNENPRYIFFKTETLNGDSGPKGAMGVPLTAMGSVAVDPRYHPYGALIWLNVKLPQFNGDYNGAKTGLLVSAQDTGGDIKGPMRGDLYFGAGAAAGEKAGVMKHQAAWTVFLPKALAMRFLSVS